MQQIVVEEFIISPYRNLNDWFADFSHLSGASLLHSGSGEHPNTQFNIASFQPLITLQVDPDGNCKVNSEPLAQVADALPECAAALKLLAYSQAHQTLDPTSLPELSEKLSQTLFANHKVPNSQLPFLVGSIGACSYDFARFLESLPNHSENSYLSPLFIAQVYHWSLVEDIKAGKVWLCYSDSFKVPDFAQIRQDLAQKQNQNQNNQANFRLLEDWQSNMTEQSYHDKIAAIHEYLRAGDCYQVNLAQRFSSTYVGNEWQAWEMLTQTNNAPFSAFVRLADSCIVSCSPERFLSVDQHGLIETKPIKGTRPRFADTQQDELSRDELINSEKDRAENLMIVDLLRNDISKNAQPGSVEVTGLFDIESFSAVHHLVSTVQAQLSGNIGPERLLQDAFPGGSITGAPKIRAMEIIDELEPNRRNIYCGSIFYLGVRGDFDSNICIRTLLFEDQKVYCWAGGGIVADSEAELEYQETFHKVHNILPVLSKTIEQ